MKKEIKNLQIVAVIIASVIYLGIKNLPFSNHAAPKGEYYYVERVVDGDTFKLSDGRRVRLIGVDTPEYHYSEKLLRDSRRNHQDMKSIQAMGRKAYDFTRHLCEGKKVRLEEGVKGQDRYGRLLVYAYLEDGTFVNARILEEGYGQVMTVPPNVKHADMFLKLQRRSREEGKGLWANGELKLAE
ncbi:MAG: thermonuclease family protein [Candidatus Omnitrophota bacterium]|jgi:micrococcal nuclease